MPRETRPPHPFADAVSGGCSANARGSPGPGARDTSPLSKVIQRVCAGSLPAAAAGAGRKSRPTPVLHQVCRWECSGPSATAEVRQVAHERPLKTQAVRVASGFALRQQQRRPSLAPSEDGGRHAMEEDTMQGQRERRGNRRQGDDLGDAEVESSRARGLGASEVSRDKLKNLKSAGASEVSPARDKESSVSQGLWESETASSPETEAYKLREESGRPETAKPAGDVDRKLAGDVDRKLAGDVDRKLAGDVDRKLDALSESMSRKLERIAYALGVRNLNVADNSGDDAEDRKRLMEKLKSAFDGDRRMRFGKAGTERERWLEYVFGICKPDQRIGKRGSRCPSLQPLAVILVGHVIPYHYISEFYSCDYRLIHPRSRFAKGSRCVLVVLSFPYD
jgi:hypothetical protein